MLKKFKFNPKDLIIGLLIISPVIFLSYRVYNKSEGGLIKRDAEVKNSINILARALDAEYKENKVYPDDLDFLEFQPNYFDEIKYTVSSDKQEMIVFSEVESLQSRSFCFSNTPYMVYSSTGNKTEIVCSDSPTPGKQKFVN